MSAKVDADMDGVARPRQRLVVAAAVHPRRWQCQAVSTSAKAYIDAADDDDQGADRRRRAPPMAIRNSGRRFGGEAFDAAPRRRERRWQTAQEYAAQQHARALQDMMIQLVLLVGVWCWWPP